MTEQNTFRFPTFALILITYFIGYMYTKYQYTKHFYKIVVINAIAPVRSRNKIFSPNELTEGLS